MRTFTTVALGLLGAAVASASDVESLTKDTFEGFVTENDLVLAECKSSCHLSPHLGAIRHFRSLANIYSYSFRSTFIMILRFH